MKVVSEKEAKDLDTLCRSVSNKGQQQGNLPLYVKLFGMLDQSFNIFVEMAL